MTRSQFSPLAVVGPGRDANLPDCPDVLAFKKVLEESGGTWHVKASSLDELHESIREHAPGEHILVLGATEKPSRGLMERLRMVAAEHPLADVIYGDTVFEDASGRQREAGRRPDWSPTRLQHENYVGETFLIRTSFFLSMTRHEIQSGAWNAWSFLLGSIRVGASVDHDRFVWTSAPAPETLTAPISATEIHVRAGIAQEHLLQSGSARTVRARNEAKYLEIIPNYSAELPPHSIVTLTAGSTDAGRENSDPFIFQHLRAIASFTRGSSTEHVVVVGRECKPDVRLQLESGSFSGISVVEVSEQFNFAHRSNRGRQHSEAEFLIFANDDFVPLDENWVHLLLAPFEDDKVAITGATLLYADGSTQHAGVGVSNRNYFHSNLGVSPGDLGWESLVATNREVDAVTGACLAIRSSVFDEVGGFFEGFPLNYNDVDLCLKVRSRGYSVVLVGTPLGYHFESQTRAPVLLEEEARLFYARWPETPLVSAYPFEVEGISEK